MAAKESKLMVFAHLGAEWAPCGQLVMAEEGPNVAASSFAYGLNCVRRADALKVDPVSLSNRDRAEVPGRPCALVVSFRHRSIAAGRGAWAAWMPATRTGRQSSGAAMGTGQ